MVSCQCQGHDARLRYKKIKLDDPAWDKDEVHEEQMFFYCIGDYDDWNLIWLCMYMGETQVHN